MLTCLLSTFTFLPAQLARRPLSHTKARRALRRLNKAHGLHAKILAPFILGVKKADHIMRLHETKTTLLPTFHDQVAAAGAFTATIHPTPKRSVIMPPLEAKTVLASGIVTVPPSESAA